MLIPRPLQCTNWSCSPLFAARHAPFVNYHQCIGWIPQKCCYNDSSIDTNGQTTFHLHFIFTWLASYLVYTLLVHGHSVKQL